MCKVRICHFETLIYLAFLKSPLSLIFPFVWLFFYKFLQMMMCVCVFREAGIKDRSRAQDFLSS